MSRRRTMRPSSPVCGVTSFMPRICSAKRCSLIDRLRNFHASALAAAARMNLSFDNHDGSAKSLRRGARFVLLEHNFAARHGNAEFGENCLGLIFVDLHAGSRRSSHDS